MSAHPLYVTVDVSESDAMMVRELRRTTAPGAEPGEVKPGEWRRVDLATSEDPRFDVQGRIDYVDPAINPETGTIRVRCRFENTDDRLLPGMFVRLRAHVDTTESMLAPDIALLSDQSGRYALVVNDKDVVELKRVRIGTLDGPMRVVLEGLADTDRVVVRGLQRARPGMTVRPTLTELEAGAAPADAGASHG
ncbi:MAG: efflux RND transporter periplasmic adaptor subunit [Phycisphaerales bacterium]|nr:efflux RND transporter periplasmic adaptor subunit [Phycisphaerales bacterium]